MSHLCGSSSQSKGCGQSNAPEGQKRFPISLCWTDNNAVVDGDFAVTEDELQPVLKSLLKDKINIVAIHQHMTHEEPRMMFFHYRRRGSAKDLAQAVKGGLLVGGLLEGQFAVTKLKSF